MIAAWLTSRLAGPIASGLSVILAITLAVLIISKNATIAELHRNVTTAGTQRDAYLSDLTQCRANRITLEDATNRQNAAVDAAKAAGDARAAALEKVTSAAKADAATATAKAAAILKRTGSTCEDADALIKGAVR